MRDRRRNFERARAVFVMVLLIWWLVVSRDIAVVPLHQYMTVDQMSSISAVHGVRSRAELVRRFGGFR